MTNLKLKLPSLAGFNPTQDVVLKSEKGYYSGRITKMDLEKLEIEVKVECAEKLEGYIEVIPILAAYITRVI